MFTVKRLNCAEIKTTMVYGDNMIAQQSNSNIDRNQNEWLHPYVRKNDRKKSKYNNQQQQW